MGVDLVPHILLHYRTLCLMSMCQMACVLYSPPMNYIKPFVYLTTAVSVFGRLVLLNEGNFDVYAFWNICALLSASYYMSKH